MAAHAARGKLTGAWTGPGTAGAAGLKERVAEELAAARRRSLAILEPVPDDEQCRQQSVLMSPLVWDLAHVGNYEDLWLLRAAAARRGVRPSVDGMYDAFRHPRANRPALPLLPPAEARAYVAEVRDEVLGALDRLDLDPARPLLAGGFVYGMVVQHEQQHDETMLATRQLMDERAAPLAGAVPPPPGGPVGPEEVLVPGGTFLMGTDVDPWAYDNERPAHPVTLDPFLIDTAPVTCARYAAFVEAGGYHDARLWSPEGWAWRQQAGVEHPQFWRREGEGAWSVLRFGRRIDLRPDEPVQHVCWYEAQACARWMGKRLPTEAEWEMAACWDPAAGKRRHPWGDGPATPQRANLGATCDGPAPVGAYPAGVSPWGCHQMLGEVWEWTASELTAYPGFRSFPYCEYSEAFFGAGYKVLRGGSWATAPVAVRGTFRNWDHAIRRQIFAGFRGARDAGRR